MGVAASSTMPGRTRSIALAIALAYGSTLINLS